MLNSVGFFGSLIVLIYWLLGLLVRWVLFVD